MHAVLNKKAPQCAWQKKTEKRKKKGKQKKTRKKKEDPKQTLLTFVFNVNMFFFSFAIFHLLSLSQTVCVFFFLL